MCKHYKQFHCNKSKCGLDNITEMTGHVMITGLKLPFEAHYILQMICGLVTNTWHATQSRKIVHFLNENSEDNPGSSMKLAQLRMNVWELSINDYVIDLGIKALKVLDFSRYQRSIAALTLRRDSG